MLQGAEEEQTQVILARLESMEQATNAGVQSLRKNIEDLLSKFQAAGVLGRPTPDALAWTRPMPQQLGAAPSDQLLQWPVPNDSQMPGGQRQEKLKEPPSELWPCGRISYPAPVQKVDMKA